MEMEQYDLAFVKLKNGVIRISYDHNLINEHGVKKVREDLLGDETLNIKSEIGKQLFDAHKKIMKTNSKIKSLEVTAREY